MNTIKLLVEATSAPADRWPNLLPELVRSLRREPAAYMSPEFRTMSLSAFGTWVCFDDQAGDILESLRKERIALLK